MREAQLLALQAGLSLIAYSMIAVVFIRPWLARQSRRWALMVLAVPQMFRHVGVTLLVPGMVGPDLPQAFAVKTAAGDLLTVALAVFTLAALHRQWRYAIGAAWVLNVVGVADLVINIGRGIALTVAPHLGAAWIGPAFVVPGMFIVHLLIFEQLLSAERSDKGVTSGSLNSGE